MRLLTLLTMAVGIGCTHVSTSPLPRPLGDTPVTDPADPDIRDLTRRQLAIAAAIAPLDSNGKESTGRLRITEVWFRRGGRWQGVGGQSTALP